MSPDFPNSSNQMQINAIDNRPGVNEQTIEWQEHELCIAHPEPATPGSNEETIEWIEPEHLALTILIEAENLPGQVGTPELAKEAIGFAAQR